MSTSYVSRHGAMSLGALVALSALLVVLITSPVSPPKEPQDPEPQEPGAEVLRYVGDAPALLSESATVVLQTSPEELVASVIAARARADLAALARCCSTSAGRAALDQLDAVRAQRDFFESEPLWARLTVAAAAKALRIEQRERFEAGTAIDASGFIACESGSPALSEVQFPIVRIRGAWFVRVSP